MPVPAVTLLPEDNGGLEDPFPSFPSYYSELDRGLKQPLFKRDPPIRKVFKQDAMSDGIQDDSVHRNESRSQKRVEYWSKTYGSWIPTEITAVDHDTCSVQINVKPGVWLSSTDWEKKLRVAVYLHSDDSAEVKNKNQDQVLRATSPKSFGNGQYSLPRYPEQAAMPKSWRDDVPRSWRDDLSSRYSDQASTPKPPRAPGAPGGEVSAIPFSSVDFFAQVPPPSQTMRTQSLDSGDQSQALRTQLLDGTDRLFPRCGLTVATQDAVALPTERLQTAMSHRTFAAISGSNPKHVLVSSLGHQLRHRHQELAERESKVQEEHISAPMERAAAPMDEGTAPSRGINSFVWEAQPIKTPGQTPSSTYRNSFGGDVVEDFKKMVPRLGPPPWSPPASDLPTTVTEQQFGRLSPERAAILAAVEPCEDPDCDARLDGAGAAVSAEAAASPSEAMDLEAELQRLKAEGAAIAEKRRLGAKQLQNLRRSDAFLESRHQDSEKLDDAVQVTPSAQPLLGISQVISSSEAAPPEASESSEARPSGGIQQEGTFVGYCCPRCKTGRLPTIESALEHCKGSGFTGSTAISMAASTTTAGTGTPSADTAASPSEEEAASGSGGAAVGNSGGVAAEELDEALVDQVAPLVAQGDGECMDDEDGLQLGAAAADEVACASDLAENLGWSKPVASILGYCCPTCGDKLPSLQEAVEHCRNTKAEECPKSVSDDSAAEVSASSGRAPVQVVLPGHPIAYNKHGQPVIARQVDPETGVGRTMVLNEDGSCDVFGQNTVASLLSSTEDEATQWIGGFSNFQLRGLVHEIGQRLVQSSQIYQQRLNQWNDLSERANLAYFGLTQDASDKDLDNAYRQMAKRMHPDKNGGTEESKERFQDMKKRYEALKQKRTSQDPEDSQHKDEEEDLDDKEQKDDKTIEFDPHDRESMHETAKKMVLQLSTLEKSKAALESQLRFSGIM